MTAHKPGDPITINRLYGRSKGKPLRQGQQGLVDTLLPRIAVPLDGPVTAERLFGVTATALISRPRSFCAFTAASDAALLHAVPSPMTVTDFRRGRRVCVRLCEVDGLGHAWSGGAAGQLFSDDKGPDASSLIWRFVAAQLPKATAAATVRR